MMIKRPTAPWTFAEPEIALRAITQNVSTILRQSCLVFRLGVLSAGSVD
jgi:hypothetical protein